MTRIFILFMLCFSILTSWSQNNRSMTPTTNNNEKRLALVIGNSTYKSKPLPNAHNDAVDMATQLRAVGFAVIIKENLNKEEMENAIADFTNKLKNYGVALFYFAGHGFMSSQKENYLMSVEMRENLTEAFAKEKSISIETLMASMDEAKSPTKLLFLDACSNNPFRGWGRSDQKGLGSVSPPEGMVAFFAASPGQEASENPGKRNGLFTQELLQQLRKPNLELTELIRNTRNKVNSFASSQRPYPVGLLSDIFYFQKKEVGQITENESVNSQKEVFENKPTTITQPQNGEIKDLPFGPPMVFVKGGSFEMGSKKRDADAEEDEMVNGKKHRASVSNFWIAQTEVTVEQYLAFCEATNSHYPEWLKSGNKYHIETGSDKSYAEKGYSRTTYKLPIAGVSWHNAVAYCEWLSEKTGLNYRLPTEAEWEFSARGGIASKNLVYAGSNTINEVGWFSSNSNDKLQKVKQKKANELGIYDMSGNVWEWCQDWYGVYAAYSQQNPMGAVSGPSRVLRGGSWNFTPQNSRVAFRNGNTPDTRRNNLGFRVISSQ